MSVTRRSQPDRLDQARARALEEQWRLAVARQLRLPADQHHLVRVSTMADENGWTVTLPPQRQCSLVRLAVETDAHEVDLLAAGTFSIVRHPTAAAAAAAAAPLVRWARWRTALEHLMDHVRADRGVERLVTSLLLTNGLLIALLATSLVVVVFAK